MVKRVIALILVLSAMVLIFSGCDLERAITRLFSSEDASLYQKVCIDKGEDNLWRAEYEGHTYIDNTENLFCIIEDKENDVLLGWSGIGYVNHYYSNTDQDPPYIYESRMDKVFLREGYDFKADSYRLEDTDSVVVFSDVVIETDVAYDGMRKYEKMIFLDLYSERFPCLYLRLVLFLENGRWFVSGTRFDGSGTGIYQITDEFVELLKQHGIITGE